MKVYSLGESEEVRVVISFNSVPSEKGNQSRLNVKRKVSTLITPASHAQLVHYR